MRGSVARPGHWAPNFLVLRSRSQVSIALAILMCSLLGCIYKQEGLLRYHESLLQVLGVYRQVLFLWVCGMISAGEKLDKVPHKLPLNLLALDQGAVHTLENKEFSYVFHNIRVLFARVHRRRVPFRSYIFCFEQVDSFIITSSVLFCL